MIAQPSFSIRHLLKGSSWRGIFTDSLTVFWGDWLDLRVRITQVIASGLVSPLIYILAFGLGILFSSGTTSDVGNVVTRYDIDRSAPNPEICVQFGASAIAVDLRAFVTLNPFSVFISQPTMLPGCVLRSSNWEVLQSRNLISSDDVNQCRRRMNTFGFTGDITNAAEKPKIDCVYQNDAARNLFLPQTGNNAAPPEIERFK